MRNKKPPPATPLDQVLGAYLKKTGMARRLDQASVIPEWPSLVGPQIASVTTPIMVTQDGKLFVRVTSSAWVQELQLMSPDILRKLGSHGKKIRRIVWQVGEAK